MLKKLVAQLAGEFNVQEYFILLYTFVLHVMVIVCFLGIFIECQGKAKVHWDKWMLRDNSRTYYECYRAEECYFRKEIVLYGAGEVLTVLEFLLGKCEQLW